jgi:hypothetical protein
MRKKKSEIKKINKKKYIEPNIRELGLNLPKQIDKQTLDEIVTIIVTTPGTS